MSSSYTFPNLLRKTEFKTYNSVVTATSGTIKFDKTSKMLVFVNTGTKTCYVGLDKDVATTSDFPILPQIPTVLDGVQVDKLAAVCGTEDTTNLFVLVAS